MAYVPPSDWELKDFIRDHADAVYRSCGFLTVGRGDALTMTREIFRKILNQGMEFRSEREARAWMILTAYQLGKKAPKGGQPEQGEELMKLSRKDRLIALLYYCEGYRKKEIADFLGCTEASVRRRLRRVKRRLDVDGDPEEAEEQQTDLSGEAKPEAEETPGQEEAPEQEEALEQEEAPQDTSLEETPEQEEVPEQEDTQAEAAIPEEAPEEPLPREETGGEGVC